MSAPFVLLEDRLAPGGGQAWLLTRPCSEWAGFHPACAQDWLADAARQGHWVVMAADYELGYSLEPATAPPAWPDTAPQAPLRYWAFAACTTLAGEAVETWLADALAALPAEVRRAGIGGLSPGMSRAAYLAAIRRIQDYIAAGDCYQVNYTFPLDFAWYGHPLALYAALRARQPVRYGGLVSLPGHTVLSLSPELFFAQSGRRLTVRPMKGTAARLPDPVADEAARVALAQSEKNRAENLMIVDLLRNDLGRVAVPGSVRVTSLFEVETYPTVHQMVSQVEATLGAGDMTRVLAALFPCGSITGAPKVRAMQIARDLETGPRGLYTGSLGWISPQGDCRLNVAIRSLVLQADGRGRMGVGSGIVADSVPEAEWEECLLKADFLTRHDPGLELIETLRLEVQGGEGRYPLLDGHLRRMARSARWLGYPLEAAQLRGLLDDLARGRADGLWRVRLGLRHSGEIVPAVVPMAALPMGPAHLRVSPAIIDGENPLRRHKTSARHAYDQALAGIADTPEVFDVLFLNARGQVVEGARSNVFIQRDGHWWTPPLSVGCLPGVFRESVLAAGLAREAELTLDDLRHAEAIRCGNALRGWVDVVLSE